MIDSDSLRFVEGDLAKKNISVGNPSVDQARESHGKSQWNGVSPGRLLDNILHVWEDFYWSIQSLGPWSVGFLLGLGYLGLTARGKNSPYSTLSDVCCIVHKMRHSGGSNQQKVSEMLLTSMSNHTRMLFKDDFSGGFFVSLPQGMRHIGCSGGENKQD